MHLCSLHDYFPLQSAVSITHPPQAVNDLSDSVRLLYYFPSPLTPRSTQFYATEMQKNCNKTK